MPPRVRIAASFLALLVVHDASAQTADPAEPRLMDLRLEQRVEDVGPLGRSLRVAPADLRSPTGFEGVYRVPGREGTLMRISGGIIATFPRSEYRGDTRPIPAGTVFHIGSVRTLLAGRSLLSPNRVGVGVGVGVGDVPSASPTGAGASLADTAAPTFVDRAADRAVGREPPGSSVGARTPPAIFTDEDYRRRRLTEILSPPPAPEANPPDED